MQAIILPEYIGWECIECGARGFAERKKEARSIITCPICESAQCGTYRISSTDRHTILLMTLSRQLEKVIDKLDQHGI